MTFHNKFIPEIQWHEGMMLSPQHFQQAERRHQQLLNYHINHLAPYHWGVEHLKFDQITLPNGLIRVLELEAIMPDGLLISHSATMASRPLEVDVTEMKADIIDGPTYIYLCVPETTTGTSSIYGEWPRFISVDGDDVVDENTADNVIRIPRLIPKISLIASPYPPARYVSFPIARIGFSEEAYSLDPFYAPCFRVSQVTHLGEMCADIARRLREKAAYLCEKWQNQIGTPLISETATQLRPIVESLPKIEPLIHSGVAHPYQLFLGLCHVAGSLSALRLSQVPPSFPPYNHNNIHDTFSPLFEWIDLVIKSIEKTYTVALFNQTDRRFHILLQPEFMHEDLMIGIKSSTNMTEGELEHWMKECIIATESHVEDARIRRITGAPRAIVQGQELFDLMPGRNVIIFKVKNDPVFITPGEVLTIINPADREEKRPLEVFLYLRHHNQQMQREF